MPQVPFIQDAYSGEVPINWFAASDQDKGVIAFGTPGLLHLVTPSADEEVRAFHYNAALGTQLYALCGSGFYEITTGLTATLKGNVSNSQGNAWIVDNGVQIAVCDGAQMYVYTIATGAWTLVIDADFPGASCLTYQDGYGAFINPGTQQFYLTALYDFTDIDALDYASAEGWPDDLTAIMMHYRELWLLGPETTEIWQNTGDADFPFGRAPGGFIEKGIVAAGSVAKFDNGIGWLSHERQVIWCLGRQPQIISTRKMERELVTYPSVDDAKAFEHTYEGHTFYTLIFPSAKVVWCYDAATKAWHKRKSRNSEDEEDRWRGNSYIYWNQKHIVGDFENGKIYEMHGDYYDDDGEELVAEIESNEINSEGKPIFFANVQVEFDHGKATGTLDPQAMLTWSDDGGNTWSTEYWVGIGKIGEYSNRCVWRRLGRSIYKRIYKLKVSDAVNRNLLGWYFNV